MSTIPRTYTQTIPPKQNNRQSQIKDFFNKEVIVVLGQPGMGKTTEFKKAAEYEENSIFVTVGEFLFTNDLSHLLDKVIYLDGLDEQRSKFKGKGVVDALVAKLKEAKPSKIRVSCRTAEWHGHIDIEGLSKSIKGSEVTQIELDPLTEEAALELIELDNKEEFVLRIKENGLENFLQSPGNLELLLSYYESLEDWPKNKADLLDVACGVLLQELNIEHVAELDDEISDVSLVNSSEYLAALMMLSGVQGISVTRNSASKAFPPVHKFNDNLFHLKVAARRRIFSQLEEGRFEPKHRKIAEFLAARYLSKRVRGGLSLNRVMTLLTGFDGKTAPDLRGVYAWLVTLLAGSAEKIIKHDPYGAVIYGDTYSWTPNTKLTALRELKNLSKQDAWFRQSDYSTTELGGLADLKIVTPIVEYIDHDPCDSHFMSIILGSLSVGTIKDNDSLTKSLLAFIKDNSTPNHYRDKAIDSLKASLIDWSPTLLGLLSDLHFSTLIDNENYLRGNLIDKLYPQFLSPTNLLGFLTKPESGYYGTYMDLLIHRIAKNSGISELKELAAASVTWLGDRKEGWKFKLTNSVSIELITENYTECTIDELLAWLDINLDEYQKNTLNSNRENKVRQKLLSGEKKILQLLIHYIKKHEDKDHFDIMWAFNSLTLNTYTDSEIIKDIYEYLTSEPEEELKSKLFNILCSRYFHTLNALELLAIEDIEQLTEQDTGLALILAKFNYSNIEHQGWRAKDIKRQQKKIADREKRINQTKADISSKEEELRVGKEVDLLQYLAMIWLDRYSDLNHEYSPEQRLKEEVGEENFELIIEGWKNSLNDNSFNTLSQIAENHLEGKTYYRATLIEVAIAQLFESDPHEVINLPEEVLQAAIGYQLTSFENDKPAWFIYLTSTHKEFVKNTVHEFWEIQLDNNNNKVSGLYKFTKEDCLYPIALEIIPELLVKYFKISVELLTTMLSCISKLPKKKKLELIDLVLKRRYLKETGKKATLLAFAFELSPIDYIKKLQTELRNNEEAKWVTYHILSSNLLTEGDDGNKVKSVEYRKDVFNLLGTKFSNVYLTGGSRMVPRNDSYDVARLLRSILNSFTEDTSDAATLVLEKLSNDKNLGEWQTELRSGLADHFRKKREAFFTYPDVTKVVLKWSSKIGHSFVA